MQGFHRQLRHAWFGLSLGGSTAALLAALGACAEPPAAPGYAEDGITAPSPGHGRQQLQGHITPAMAAAPWVGDPKGLAQAVELVSNPNSPAYRRYLTLEQFAEQHGADRGTYQKVIDSNPSALSALSSAPSVNARGFGVLEIFGQLGSNIIHRTYRAGFGPWQSMPAVTATSAPASVSWASNRIDVFVKGASNELRHAWREDGSDWGGWENLGCCFDTAPTVSSWAPGRLDIFIGAGGSLWHLWHDNGWGDWENLGGSITSAPAAVSWASGRIDIFAKGASNELTHLWYSTSGGWGRFENLGCCFDTAPGVASWGSGRLDVFQGSGGSVWHLWHDNGWGRWENIGGSVTSGLSATSWGFGRIDIMARDTSNQLAHQWYDIPSGWGRWESL